MALQGIKNVIIFSKDNPFESRLIEYSDPCRKVIASTIYSHRNQSALSSLMYPEHYHHNVAFMHVN